MRMADSVEALIIIVDIAVTLIVSVEGCIPIKDRKYFNFTKVAKSGGFGGVYGLDFYMQKITSIFYKMIQELRVPWIMQKIPSILYRL